MVRIVLNYISFQILIHTSFELKKKVKYKARLNCFLKYFCKNVSLINAISPIFQEILFHFLGNTRFRQLRSRSSHQRYSIKNAVLKNSAIFTGKHLCWSLFLMNLQAFRPPILLKRDSYTGVFL